MKDLTTPTRFRRCKQSKDDYSGDVWQWRVERDDANAVTLLEIAEEKMTSASINSAVIPHTGICLRLSRAVSEGVSGEERSRAE